MTDGIGAPPLAGDVVIDLSTGIAGGYCTKVLADGGAEVIKVEAPGGDPLRRWSSSGSSVSPDDDGALFRFLAASKRSIVADPAVSADVELVRSLASGADLVIWSPGSLLAELDALRPEALRELAPHAVVVAVTPFGLEGPWADRPSTEGTRQAWGGGTGQRGTLDRPPLIVGGRLGEWASGMIAAVGALASRHRTVATGVGELVDVSMLEVETLVMTMYPVTFASIAGAPMRAHRVSNLPGIHPTKDGFVGFMVVTGQQWLDFCAMTGREDWFEDESLLRFENRNHRRAELVTHIDKWTSQQATDEVVELASAFRIPVAAVGNGANLADFDHFRERHTFVENPSGGFLQPDIPYVLSVGAGRRPPRPPPRLGEHDAEVRAAVPPARPAPTLGGADRLPFEGLRVADFTANWAGPIVGHLLAMLGADVIKVESGSRPDPLRFNTVKTLTEAGYWEWSPLQHGPNTNKRGVTINLQSKAGIDVAKRLIGACDVVLENFSPRVFDNWGLDYLTVRDLNPAIVMVRMPAFGLSGPWRDRVGYAQTIEQQSGLAWLTGFPDGAPEIPNGPCDPIAGSHATIALLLALEHRRRTGEGVLVEVPMIGGALNLAAEQIIEYTAYGKLLERIGNRSRTAAPQNTYLSADILADGRRDQWVTISVETDQQWVALVGALGSPDWAADPALGTAAGRQAAHDALDAELTAWCFSRSSDEIVNTLWSAGVPVGVNLLPHQQADVAQLVARGYWETVNHPVTGENIHAGYPAQFSNGPRPGQLHRSPPPLLGQHNEEVFTKLLGMTRDEITALEESGAIGRTPLGGTAW